MTLFDVIIIGGLGFLIGIVVGRNRVNTARSRLREKYLVFEEKILDVLAGKKKLDLDKAIAEAKVRESKDFQNTLQEELTKELLNKK